MPCAAEGYGSALTCLLIDLLAGDRAEKVPVAVFEGDQLHGVRECCGDCGFYEPINAHISCERPARSDPRYRRSDYVDGANLLSFDNAVNTPREG